jgi:hypothetical protein
MLRETLARVELTSDVCPDDPALSDLKRMLLLKIAALEAKDRLRAAGNDPASPEQLAQ